MGDVEKVSRKCANVAHQSYLILYFILFCRQCITIALLILLTIKLSFYYYCLFVN